MTDDRVRRVFDGRVFRVTVERVNLPSGRTLDAELVRHAGSVVLIPVRGDGRIVLVRQFRATVNAPVWELPAGRVEAGEDLLATAARECHEEVGLIPGRLEPLGSFLSTLGFCDERITMFRATALREPGIDDPEARPDEDEDITVEAFTRTHIEAMVRRNDIIDLKTVAALALLDLHH